MLRLSNPETVWSHLRNDIAYETYSDSKLAQLYFDNIDEFPVHILAKVFDVLLDPLFKLEDITFKNVWDIFHYISTYRREKLSPSSLRSQLAAPSTESPPLVLPTDIVSLVVDKMVENRKPLGVASRGQGWQRAYVDDVSDLHAMSLVHPSWTPIVRNALRRRVIVPYHQIDSFLLSPLCGPWVTEAIIYWTVDIDNDMTDSNVDLFEALMKRVPNLHSFAFRTSLVWLIDQNIPRLCADACLKLMSALLPSLEHLWLHHFEARPEIHCYPPSSSDSSWIEDTSLRSMRACYEMETLYALLPRMQSLKSLSLYGWEEGKEEEIDWSEHPCSNFVTLDLVDKLMLSRQGISRMVMPRHGFHLRSLSIVIRQLRLIECPLPSLQELRLYLPRKSESSSGPVTTHLSNILEGYDQLVDLDLFVNINLDLSGAVFPKNLENITIHANNVNLRWLMSMPITPYSLPWWRSSSNFVPTMNEHVHHISRLQSLGLIGVRSIYGTWVAGWNSTIEGVPVREIPKELLNLCEEHNIKLICRNASEDESESEDGDRDEDDY